MNSKKLLYSAVFMGMIALVVGGANILSAKAAPEGTLIGWCVDNGTSPYIYLEWGSHPSANSNGLQKADVSPAEDRFWGWLGTYDTQRSYADYAISRGQTYWYRVKYRPELPSNVIVVSCPFYPAPTPTVYPTPTPYLSLAVWPTTQTVDSGQTVTLYASGGTGSYFWTSPGASQTSGYGQSVSLWYTNNTSSLQSYTVAVTSGTQTSYATVYVRPAYIYPTPTPTWYPTPYPTYYPTPYPTWYPTVTPVPNANLELTHVGRNVTRGQSGEYASVIAGGNDTLDFIVRVRNTTGGYLYNVILNDVLPTGIYPIAGSTTLNNRQVGDGISGNGINIGTLAPYATATVKLSVRVDPSAVPSWGSATTSNVMQARADGMSYRSVLFRITLSNSNLASISSVATGVEDALIPSLAIALMVAGLYGAYTRTNTFRRRASIAEIRACSGTTTNFTR